MRGAKVVSLTLSAALLASMVGITGCGKNNTNNFRTQNANNGNRYDLNARQNTRVMGLKYSPQLSNKVSHLSQIRTAQVLVTDRDAYVAVTLHGPHGTSGTGYRAKSVAPGAAGTRTGGDGLGHGIGRSGVAGSLMDAARGGTYGTNGTGGTRTYGTYGADGRGAGTNLGTGYYGGMNGGISGNSYYSYGGGTGTRSSAGTGYGHGTGIGNYGTAGTGMNGNIMSSTGTGAANGTGNGTGMSTTHPGYTGAHNYSTNSLRGTDGSFGLSGGYGSYGTYGPYTPYGTGMNGYGTYGTNSTNATNGYGTYGTAGSYGTNGTGALDNIPQSLKDQITAKVKASAPHIQNVHISGHPEFVSRVSSYATQSKGGKLLTGVESEFSSLIQRIFPARTGTMTGPSGYTPTPRNTNGTGTGTMNRTNTSNGYSGGVTR
ncbi:YhcN/YlaJ family sporulation lipoprotein [Paenibacillus tuaregi]|uniref:YhcN/YlaJ family sporulation lipoprotein n=1 Tax=Paenibacillus tuaregi TaxID=1816681 RepID=UPI0008384C3E|nr:YhcN/YlaJ family sporulation lipoprotein [Paenibacillus tuaregi]